MLPLCRPYTNLSKEAYAENLAKVASELRVLESILWGKFFVPNLWQKWYVHENFLSWVNIGFTDLSKDAYAENLAKIASELSFLEPI